jgi:PAS domain S-box-containing protein
VKPSAPPRPGNIALLAIERDRAQAALTNALAAVRKSESELRTMVEMIPQLMAVLDPDGQTLYVNELTLDYTGLSAEEASGNFRRRVFHPEDVERLKEERARALVRGEAFENEQRARRHDGQYRWFLIRYRALRDDHGRVVRWYCTATDIDDRKRSEEGPAMRISRFAKRSTARRWSRRSSARPGRCDAC